MGGADIRHLLCMLAIFLVLLSTRRCQARPSFMEMVGPSGVDADFFNSFGRQLLATPATSCSGAFQPLPEAPLEPPTDAVQWNDLSSYRWSVPATRPNYGGSSPSSLFSAADFFSLMCNGFGRVRADRQECTTQANGANSVPVDSANDRWGATHMRYDCASKSLWVLTYVFADRIMLPDISDMYVKSCSNANDCTNSGQSAGEQFVKVADGGSPTDMDCKETCAGLNRPSCSAGVCSFCCQELWPVVDGTAWIGYIAKMAFIIPSPFEYIQEGIIVHYDGYDGPTTNRTVSSAANSANPVCLYCSRCPTVSVAAPVNPPCHTGTEQVDFNFTWSSSNASAGGILPSTPTTGCSVLGPFGNIYTVRCPAQGANSLTATLNITQTVSGCATASDEKSATRPFCSPPCPAVNVTALSNGACWPEDATKVKFNYTVTTNSSAGTASFDVTPSTCQLTGNIGDIYTVECDVEDPGTTATLTYTQTVLGCTTAASDSDVAIQTECPPNSCTAGDLTLTPGDAPNVCSDSAADVPFTFVATTSDLDTLKDETLITTSCSITGQVAGVDASSSKQTRTYSVSCPAGTSTANFSVTQDNPDVPGQSCDRTIEVKAGPAVVTTRPDIAVQAPNDANVCSTNPSGTYTYTITSNTGDPISIGANGITPGFCYLSFVGPSGNPGKRRLSQLQESLLEPRVVRPGEDEPTRLQPPITRPPIQLGTNIIPLPISVPSDSEIQITCPQIASTFTLTLTTSMTTSVAGCDDTDTKPLTVTFFNKPEIEVEKPPDATICSDVATKDFEYVLKSSTGVPITIDSSEPLGRCMLSPPGSPATVNSNTAITIRCTQDGDWGTLGKVILTTKAASGMTGCDDTLVTEVSVTPLYKPGVTVEVEPHPSVCSNSGEYETMWTVSNDRGVGLNVYLTTETTSPAVSCRMEDSLGSPIGAGGPVASNTRIKVKCNHDDPLGNWPASVKVTLRADAGDASCLGTDSQDTTITSSPKPTITIQPPNTPKVCSEDEQKEFDFTPSLTTALGLPITITSITANPTTSCGLISPLSTPLALPTDVQSGATVRVRCERPSNGWETFTLTLGTSTTTPDVANCGDIKNEEVTVQAYVKPAVTVSLDSAPGVCSDSPNSDSTWTVSRDTAGTLDVALTEITPGLTCRLKDSGGVEITGQGVANGTQITLTCDKPGEGGWPVSYTAKVTATAGEDATCQGFDFKEAAINRIIKPSLTLTSPQSVPLCTDSTGPFSFLAEVTNTAAGSTETFRVNATWEGVDCVADPYEAGPAATNVTITCPMPTGGYTAGSATKVTVKATAGATGCLDNQQAETTVAVTQKPTVGITGDPTRTVCADTTASFDLDYPTSWTPASKTPTAAGVQPGYCSRVPDFTTNPGNIRVTCTNSTQWPDDTFTVTVNGTVQDGICGGADTKSTTVTFNRKPGISLSVTQSPSNLCDNTGSVEFIYTVGLTPTGAEDSISVTMDPPAANSFVICGGPTKLTAGPNTGKWRVNCTGTSGGVLPAGTFTFKITAEAGAEGCKQTISEEKTVTTPGCCATGSSYAFGTALEDTTRLAFGTGTCFNNITEMNCGTTSNNWGWRNDFAGEGQGTFKIYAGGAVGCKNWKKMVGTITVSCVDVTGGARVMMYMPQQALVGGADLSLLDHHMYVGCKEWAPLMSTTTTTNRKTGVKTTTTTASPDRSPTCTPPAYNAPKDSLSATFLAAFASGSGPKCGGSDADNTIMGASSPKGRCGGNCYNVLVPRSETTLQAATVASSGMLVEGCSCSGLYWVYHQSSKDNAKFTYDPVQGVC